MSSCANKLLEFQILQIGIPIFWLSRHWNFKKKLTGIFGIENGIGIPLAMGVPEIGTENWNSQPRSLLLLPLPSPLPSLLPPSPLPSLLPSHHHCHCNCHHHHRHHHCCGHYHNCCHCCCCHCCCRWRCHRGCRLCCHCHGCGLHHHFVMHAKPAYTCSPRSKSLSLNIE